MSAGLRTLVCFVCLFCTWAVALPALATSWHEYRDTGLLALENADYLEAAEHFEMALIAVHEAQAGPQNLGVILERLTTAYFAAGLFRSAQDAIEQWDDILKTSAGEPWVHKQRTDRDRLALLVYEALAEEAGEDLTIGVAADQSFEAAQEIPTTQLASQGYAIHLVSVRNQDSVDLSWAELKESFPELLSGKALEVRPIDLADQGTFYRLHAFPFADAAEAEAACEKFRLSQKYCAVVALD